MSMTLGEKVIAKECDDDDRRDRDRDDMIVEGTVTNI